MPRSAPCTPRSTHAIGLSTACVERVPTVTNRANAVVRHTLLEADLPDVARKHPFDPVGEAVMGVGVVLDTLAAKRDTSGRPKTCERVARAIHHIEHPTVVRYRWRGERVLNERPDAQVGG